MSERGLGESKDNPHLAAKAALLTRAAKRDIDRSVLERGWKRQAKALGFAAGMVKANARKAERGHLGPNLFAGPEGCGLRRCYTHRWYAETPMKRKPQMKLSKAAVRGTATLGVEVRFETQILKSYSGLILFQHFFSLIGIKERLWRCFRHLEGNPIYGHQVVVMLLVVHLIIGHPRLRDLDYYRGELSPRR